MRAAASERGACVHISARAFFLLQDIIHAPPVSSAQAEFWWCYFSWCYEVLNQHRGLRARAPATEEEIEAAQAAEDDAENADGLVARYDAEVLEPLRTDLETLKEAYKQHLAASTDRPGLKASKDAARKARALKETIAETEKLYAEARAGLRERMASMREGSRRGRKWTQ